MCVCVTFNREQAYEAYLGRCLCLGLVLEAVESGGPLGARPARACVPWAGERGAVCCLVVI